MATATATKRFTSRDLFAANQELLSVKRTRAKTWCDDGTMKHDVTVSGRFIKLMRFVRQQMPSDAMVDPATTTVGLLDRLSHLAITSAMAGDIGRDHDNDEIAEAIGWLGDADLLIEAMVKAGWLIECNVNRLIVADWKDNAPNFIKGNLSKHGRNFANAQNHVKSDSAKQGAQGRLLEQAAKQVAKQGAQGTLPYNTTQQNTTKPNKTKEKTSSKSKDDFDGVGAFDEFWNVVHKKVGKAVAKSEFAKAVASAAKEKSIPKATAAKLITEAMKAFAQSPSASPKDHTPIHPSNWLKQGRYDDDRDAWQGNTAKPDPGKRFDPNFDYAEAWK